MGNCHLSPFEQDEIEGKGLDLGKDGDPGGNGEFCPIGQGPSTRGFTLQIIKGSSSAK